MTYLCTRGLATGIYTTNSPEACQYVAANCEANILVVENQKQLDKILQVSRFIAASRDIYTCKISVFTFLYDLSFLTG